MSGTNRAARGLALLGGDSHASAIGRVCAEQGLGLESYEDVEALLADSSQTRCVVLCADDSGVASATAEIGRLISAGAGPVLVVCERLRPWELRAALEAGASGVVLEREVDTALGPCLQAAHAGQICVPRQHSQQIEPPALSSREKQILGLVVMGHTNGQIAAQLFLAESTVKSHLSSAFSKLGVRSRNEAVDLILDSARGLGMGILALGGEPVELVSTGDTMVHS